MRNVAVAYTKNNFVGKKICEAFEKAVIKNNDRLYLVKNISDLSLCLNADIFIQVCDASKHLGKDLRYFIKKTGKPRVIIDTGFFKNKRLHTDDLEDRYFSVSLNGIKTQGNYFAYHEPSDRFDSLGIDIHPFSINKNGYILVLGQHEVGTSVQNDNVYYYFDDMIRKAKEYYPGKEIVMRPHPNQNFTPRGVDRVLSNQEPLQKQIECSFLTISMTTNASIDVVINGRPLYTEHKGCMAYIFGNNLTNFTEPDSKKVKQWCYNLAYSQWTIDEMAEGIPYERIICNNF